ncbi:MAG: isochorismatase family protein [Candidatus Woesearchaeota archaeon]
MNPLLVIVDLHPSVVHRPQVQPALQTIEAAAHAFLQKGAVVASSTYVVESDADTFFLYRSQGYSFSRNAENNHHPVLQTFAYASPKSPQDSFSSQPLGAPEQPFPRPPFLFERTTLSVFSDLQFLEFLKRYDIDTLVFCGAFAQTSLYASALDALAHDYKVFFLGQAIVSLGHEHLALASLAELAPVLTLDSLDLLFSFSSTSSSLSSSHETLASSFSSSLPLAPSFEVLRADPSCIFCKILQKSLPAALVYEDEFVMAFLDIAPAADGHTLVVPKYHASVLRDLPSLYYASLLRVVTAVAHALAKQQGSNDYNLLLNAGPLAGQEVNHLHFHVLPRTHEDGIAFKLPRTKNPDSLAKTAAALREVLMQSPSDRM